MTEQEIVEVLTDAMSFLQNSVEGQEPAQTYESEPVQEPEPQRAGPVSEYPEAEGLAPTVPEPFDEIPQNSATALIDETTTRFSSAVWYRKIQEKTVLLAGLGGIGSWVALLLSRMKPSRIIMYDPDTVEAVNMAGQMFHIDDVGLPKVNAMTSMMHKYSNYFDIMGFSEPFRWNTSPSDIMMCGFDNMDARRTFFHVWKNHVDSLDPDGRRHCLFIDGRLAAEEFQVLCIRGDDTYNMDRYEREWLFDDSEAENEVCSYKQTTFMANMIGSVMVNLFVNFCANDIEGEEHPLIDRDLPFLTTYDASMMMFHTEA